MSAWMQQYLDAWNSHDGDKVLTWMADDATYEDVALGVSHKGHDAIKRFVEETNELSSDYEFQLVSVQQAGNRYAAEWHWVGTHTGPAEGVRATYKPFRLRGASVGELDANGRIQHNSDYWSFADMLMQLGLLPSRGSRGERVMKSLANVSLRLRRPRSASTRTHR